MSDQTKSSYGGVSFSSDEKHQATLDLLQEVLDYLYRLPPVPVTRELCRKVQRHLEEPTQRLVQMHLAEENRTLTQTVYAPVGFPVIKAKLVGRRLTLSGPKLTGEQIEDRPKIEEAIIDALFSPDGLTLELRPPRT